jgi:hypothetical protein
MLLYVPPMAKRPKASPPAEDTPEPPQQRGRLTLVLPEQTLDRVRNAAFWTPGETLAAIGARAVLAELARIERANGGPFPDRTQPVRKGRPTR